MEDLKYPVGKFHFPKETTPAERREWIDELAGAGVRVRDTIQGLSDAQLDTPYRPGGWTLRQVVHHLADSHLNAYTRLRLALTEDTPTIRAYDQDRWANLSDAKSGPVDVSIRLLEAIHERWVALIETLDETALSRSFRHPEIETAVRLDVLLAMYAWHIRHHVAQITGLRQRNGWE